jgi:hypothetical protein
MKTIAQEVVLNAGHSLAEGGKLITLNGGALTSVRFTPPRHIHFYKGNHGKGRKAGAPKVRRCSTDIRAFDSNKAKLLYLELQARSLFSSQSQV